MAEQPETSAFVPWSDPTQCPTCQGEARHRDLEGEREWDPVRIDPADVEEVLRAAEAPISLIRESLGTLEALGDEGASDLAGDTRRLLMIWDRFKEIAQTRVERARKATEAAPNVLSPEEARLLRRFHLNDPVLEDAEDYEPALCDLLARLSKFAAKTS